MASAGEDWRLCYVCCQRHIDIGAHWEECQNRYYSIQIIAQIGFVFISRDSLHPPVEIGTSQREIRSRDRGKTATKWWRRWELKKSESRKLFVFISPLTLRFLCAILLCRPSSVFIHSMVVSLCCKCWNNGISVVICGDVLKCQKCKFVFSDLLDLCAISALPSLRLCVREHLLNYLHFAY